MPEVTFNESDYLCLGSGGTWGRSKTAKDAFRLMRLNLPSYLIDNRNRATVLRIADCVDKVSVGIDGVRIKSFKGGSTECPVKGVGFDELLPMVLCLPVTTPVARIADDYEPR